MKLFAVIAILASTSAFGATSRTQTCEELVSLTRGHFAVITYNMESRIESLEVDGVSADERAQYNSLKEKVRLAKAMDAEEIQGLVSRCEAVN